MELNKNLNISDEENRTEVKGVPINFQSDETYSPLIHSTLKLFNAVPVKSENTKKLTKKIIKETIQHGFILSPEVFGNYSDDDLQDIIELASNEIGLSPKQMNASFHKSWKKVRDTPILELVIEQIFHYITTYGYESLGIYDKNTVYFPDEKLKIPKLKDGIKLAVINGYSKDQLKEKLLNLLSSGIALKTIDEIIEIATYCEIGINEFSKINNKEVRVRLYDKMNILPELPIEFLRFIIYKSTGNSLVITNKDTIDEIKNSDTEVRKLFKQYDENFGYKKLAEIFLRFKPLFLAYRKDQRMSSIINKISHLSKKYHKPTEQPLMNLVTGILKNNETLDTEKLKEELKNSNIFRKIRLLNALNYRIYGTESILYKIRNGKSYATTTEFDNITEAKNIEKIVLKSIVSSLKHLEGKKIYIPKNIKYALPATAKQFTGNIPSGSYVTIPRDMIFGIYWENVKSNRIDLDLSIISLNHGKIGWDARYRIDASAILFSGDVTDAGKGGASELFYISRRSDDVQLMFVNYYNYRNDIPVPFKILVAEEKPKDFGNNYMVNPNNVKCTSKTEIKEKQKILGLVVVKDKEARFYFSEASLGKSITSSDSKYSEITRDYLQNYTTSMITLNDILDMVGAELIEKPQKNCIDLSPQTIQKDSFIDLLTKFK